MLQYLTAVEVVDVIRLTSLAIKPCWVAGSMSLQFNSRIPLMTSQLAPDDVKERLRE